jgi:hypothetical protein
MHSLKIITAGVQLEKKFSGVGLKVLDAKMN